MEERCKSRCGNCGAEIHARHLGKYQYGDGVVPIGYCERCNAFTVPIGEDEKPCRERIADARLRIPRGWSRRQCEDGSLELRRGVPFRWLWAFPVGLVLLVFCVCMATSLDLFCMDSQKWVQVLATLCATLGFALGILTWILALCRLTARRYRLSSDRLMTESLWLGCIPMCRRAFERTEITSGSIQEQGKDFLAVWTNGYDRREFWRGRSKEESEFIDANLLSLGTVDAMNVEPLLCGKCGAEFHPQDIDMRNDSLVCQSCGTKTDCGTIEYARIVRYRMRFRPQGVVDIPSGFELRERRLWSGALGAALSRYVAVYFIVVSLAGLFEKLPAPWVYIPIAILLLLLAAVPVWLVASAIVGRFGVHRITAQDGWLTYFHGIGKLGRRWGLPLDLIGDVGVTHRGSLLDRNASIPNAFVICVKGERKMRRTFRDCPPLFYHWVEGWLRETLRTSKEKLK